MKKDVATQTELPKKRTAVQASGCRECLSFSLDCSRDSSCVRCDQVDDLFSLVAELQDEVERLGSVRAPERAIDWWNQSLASMRQEQPPEIMQDQGNPMSILQQEGSSCKERSEWRVVHAWGASKIILHPPHSPSVVPLHKNYESFYMKDQPKDEEDESLLTPEVSPQLEMCTSPYCNNSQEEENTGCSCRWFPSKGDRGPNMLTGPNP